MYKSVFTFWTFNKFIGNVSSSTFLTNSNRIVFQMQQWLKNMIKYGDNYYSIYQTEDKKYECRTRPFEGFFISSVEFCKIKIDKYDRKVNRTGTHGPPGPA